MMQPIKSFIKLAYMIWELWIFKPRWLTDIDLFINLSIQESTLDIHLKHFEVLYCSKSQENSNGFNSCNWSKNFIIINSFFLCVPLYHKSCFILDDKPSVILLVPKHPFCAYCQLPSWQRAQGPNSLSLEL